MKIRVLHEEKRGKRISKYVSNTFVSLKAEIKWHSFVYLRQYVVI